ncbi:MAG: endonuclease/exonuclease/phosphatase family protein [Spirochaetales bacterium]|nr:endonuclease/exonuclease/phosphatase family protein [Spirochaetales bacterium]
MKKLQYILVVFLFACGSEGGSISRSQDGIDITVSSYPHIVEDSALQPEISTQSQKLTVLQFNIWQEGTVVPGGFDAIVEEILRTDAELVALSEVRNYGGVRFDQKIVAALADRGATYYSFRADDTGLLSKFPIVEESLLYPVTRDHGSITKAVVKAPSGVEIAFYSAHLDYMNCAYYDVRGYCGSSWRPKRPVTDHDKIRQINLASKRDDAIAVFVGDAQIEREKGRIVILGGDFNEPSHLDWLESNKNLYERKGVTYQWDVSVMLEKAGFIDSYREKYPDPITHPGFTFPSGNPLMPISKLTWAPKSDERERIDFIYFGGDSRMQLVDSFVFGPDYSIAYSRPAVEPGEDRILLPKSSVWPTDHKAVISVFELN